MIYQEGIRIDISQVSGLMNRQADTDWAVRPHQNWHTISRNKACYQTDFTWRIISLISFVRSGLVRIYQASSDWWWPSTEISLICQSDPIWCFIGRIFSDISLTDQIWWIIRQFSRWCIRQIWYTLSSVRFLSDAFLSFDWFNLITFISFDWLIWSRVSAPSLALLACSACNSPRRAVCLSACF